MARLDDFLNQIGSVAIAGHVSPDGDCAGSSLAVYNYIKDQFPEIEVNLFLEPIPEKFHFLKRSSEIITLCGSEKKKEYDLFIALDCGDIKRLGKSGRYFETACKTVCIDHHMTNQKFADFNYVFPNASSTSELVYELMNPDFITKEIAECLYLGIVHDTGVFQYSCTSSKTMRVAGKLMDMGIDYPKIVDETFFVKTFVQNQILGEALTTSRLYLEGTCIVSILKQENLDKYHASLKDLDGTVNALRSTQGVETAIFIHPSKDGGYKLSMRSASYVDVAAIALSFGGGGHCRAAGASFQNDPEEVINKILPMIEKQQKEHRN